VSELASKAANGSLVRLREAARMLFVAQGYHSTRPQDIAREAGLGNGTFYLHFRDKKEAFLDFAAEAQRELLEQLRAALQGVNGPRRRLRAMFGVIADFSVTHPGVLQAAFLDPVFVAPDDTNAWHMYDRMGRFVNMVLVNANAQGSIYGDYDLELMGHAMCGMLRHAMIYASRKGVDRERMIDMLALFIDRGLGFEDDNET